MLNYTLMNDVVSCKYMRVEFERTDALYKVLNTFFFGKGIECKSKEALCNLDTYR